MTATGTETRTLVNIPEIAERLGFGVPAVKKWRQNTIHALRRYGQEFAVEPTCPLPRNALPLPVNQKDVVEKNAHPKFDFVEVERWARRTSRKDPQTGQATNPGPPGSAPRS